MHTCGDCRLGVRCFGGLFGCGLIAVWLCDFVNSVVFKIKFKFIKLFVGVVVLLCCLCLLLVPGCLLILCFDLFIVLVLFWWFWIKVWFVFGWVCVTVVADF